MSKPRRAQRRERRTYKQWLKKKKETQERLELRRFEEQILNQDRVIARANRPNVEWEVKPPLPPGEHIVSVDYSRDGDAPEVMVGRANADGTFTLFPRQVGAYDIALKINE